MQRIVGRSLIAMTAFVVVILAGCDEPSARPFIKHGQVVVTSDPGGARVFLDDSDTGRVTPYTITDVPEGSHTIVLTLKGYEDWGPETVAVAAGETATVEAVLTMEAPEPDQDQPEHGMGLVLMDVEAYQSARILRAEPVGTLPLSVDLSADVPLPGNQGSQGSCVAWTVAYALKSYHERMERGWVLNDYRHLMSPAYVYNQIKVSGGGAHFATALNLLTDQGVSSWSLMPYNEFDDDTWPSAAARDEATDYRIAEWGTVQRGHTHRDFVREIKSHLTAGNPVLIGIPTYPDFDQLSDSNPVYDVKRGARRGLHAVMIVGYSDTMAAFKIINSWGTEWGIDGYGWIDYDAEWAILEAYVARDVTAEPEPPPPAPDPPRVIRPLDALTFASPTAGAQSILLTDHVTAADAYTTTVTPAGIVTAVVAGDWLTITPRETGRTVVEIEARNEGGTVTLSTLASVERPSPPTRWRAVDTGAWGGVSSVASKEGAPFVVIADGRVILHSIDGIAWEPANVGMPSYSLWDVAAGDTGFVVVGSVGFANPREWVDDGRILHSHDGVSWTEVDAPSSPGLGVVEWDRSRSRFFAYGPHDVVLSSADGIAWKTVTDVTWTDKRRAHSAWNGARFVTGSRTGHVAHSEDGVFWEDVPIVTRDGRGLDNMKAFKVVWGGAQFVAVGVLWPDGGPVGDNLILHSPDGDIWTSADITARSSDRSRILHDVAWNGTRFVAALQNESVVLVSP